MQICHLVRVVRDVKVRASFVSVLVDGGPVEGPSSLLLRVVVSEAGCLATSRDLRRHRRSASTEAIACAPELTRGRLSGGAGLCTLPGLGAFIFPS